jgi:hypothetical protein
MAEPDQVADEVLRDRRALRAILGHPAGGRVVAA